MQLTELALKFGTDKGVHIGEAHGYTIVYDLLFAALKSSDVALAELGLQVGASESNPLEKNVTDVPSARMWLTYFPNISFFGIDICDFTELSRGQFTFLRADAGIAVDLKRVVQELPPVDIFIDDGSHASYHQQLTLQYLFPKVKKGGFYIIEDLHWQPDPIEKIGNIEFNTAEIAKLAINDRFSGEQNGTKLFKNDFSISTYEAVRNAEIAVLFSTADLNSMAKHVLPPHVRAEPVVSLRKYIFDWRRKKNQLSSPKLLVLQR